MGPFEPVEDANFTNPYHLCCRTVARALTRRKDEEKASLAGGATPGSIGAMRNLIESTVGYV